MLITSAKSLDILSTPLIYAIPQESSDLEKDFVRYEGDTLIIGYDHSATSMNIYYDIFLGGSAKEECNQRIAFSYEFENTPPTIENIDFSIQENVDAGSEIGVIGASDKEDNELSFEITQSSKEGLIEIDQSGKLSLTENSVFDYESFDKVDLVISVTDGWATQTAEVQINVTNVNEAPMGKELVEKTIPENPEQESVIGNLGVEDPDGDNLTYSIVEAAPDGALDVSESGDVLVANSALLDFENQNEILMTVEASDGELSFIIEYKLSLTDVNEEPVVQKASFEIEDTLEPNSIIGTLEAEDPEGKALVFSISSGDTDNLFGISSNTGEIVLTREVGEIESDKEYFLNVQVSDGELNTITEVKIVVVATIITSIDEEAIPDLNVYPNPVKDFLQIAIDKNLAYQTKFSLTDPNGNTLTIPASQKIISDGGFYVGNLLNGIYILRVVRGTSEQIIKIAKQ